ncbi:MAG: DUF3144 domain-containing protein [Thiotrichaceae bacterium]|nr:DUF3144 domain-containing protein [Thiotrichaceae bacterium]
MSDTEEEAGKRFYDRADKHIDLANTQMNDKASEGDVSASFLYAASRFNAWISAASFKNAEELTKEKSEIVEYFTKEYRTMLEDNIDSYIEHFDEDIGTEK